MKRKLKAAGILVIAGILTLSPCSVYAGSLDNGSNLEDGADYELENNSQNSEQPPESESMEESEDMSETENSGNLAEENERKIETENDGKSVTSEENNEVSENENQIASRSVNSAYQGKAVNDSGNFANVVVFVEFTDTVHNHIQSSWGECYHNNPKLTELFQGDDNHPRALKKYLQNISYGELEVANIFPQYDSNTNKIYPYTLKNNLDYYADDSEGDSKIIDEVTNILASSNQISSDILLDRNGDGCVDNLTIIVPCEGEGNSNKKYYGHQSTYKGDGEINSKSVAKYTLVTESVAYLSVGQSGVIAHEFLHTLGYQDLYKIHTNDTKVSPVGRWDIMASQSQWLQYPLAYFRSANTQWFSIPTVTESQKNYSLYAASAATEEVKDRQAVILKTDYSPSEFFVLEYRKKTDGYDGKPYDQMIYGSGLVIYRINTAVGSGNSFCPPYMAYVFRPGDTYDENGYERADESLLEQSFFSDESGRTSFGNSDKDADVTKNAITYSDGTNSGIVISNIGSASGDQISFDISFTGSEDSLKWRLETEDTTGLTLKEIDSCRDDSGAVYYIAQTGAFSDQTSAVLKYGEGGWSKIADGPKGSDHKIVMYNNEIYTLYLDSEKYVRLDKLNGNSWSNLFKSKEVSTFGGIILNASNEGLCFAYMDEYVFGKGNTVYAYSYLAADNTVNLNGTFSGASGLTHLSVSLINSDMILEYRDAGNSKIYVKKYDKKSGTWINLLDGTKQANGTVIKRNGNQLYLLQNGTTYGNNKSYLYVYDLSAANGSWTQVGSNEVMDCSVAEMDICFAGNRPYVVYLHQKSNTYTTYMMSLENNQWVQLGSEVYKQALSDLACYYNDGKIYVTYLDSTAKRVHVRSMQLNEETEKEIPIESIALNKSSCTLKVGENTALTAVISPENTTEEKTLTWVSSDDSVAAVDSKGEITAKKAGTAVVTVKTSNGKTSSCTVTVENNVELKGTLKNSASNYEYENRRMTLTADVTQGNGGYEYRFEEVYGGRTTVVQDYSSQNTYGFTTKGVGSHTYNVKVKDALGKTLTLSYTMTVVKYPTVNFGCTLKSNKSTSEYSARSVTLTAGVSGGSGGYEYQFEETYNGKTTVVQAYSGQNTYSFMTKEIGQHTYKLSVKDSTGNVVTSSYSMTVVLHPALKLAGTLTTGSSGREYVKRNVVLKANLSNEGYGECQYQFSRVVGGREDIIKEYSVDNTYTFVTDKIGQNTFYVTIKDKANQILKIRCNTSVTVVEHPSLNLAGTLKSNKTGNEYERRSVVLTADITQGNGGYEYQFEEAYNGKTTVVQAYSNKNTYTFTTQGVGNHTYYARVKDALGKTLTLSYTMTVVKYPTVNFGCTLKSNKSTSEYSARSVTLTAGVSGGSGGYEYQFEETYNGKTTVVQAYSSQNTYSFMTKEIGQHTYKLSVKDSTGNVVTSSYSMTVVLHPALKLAGTLTTGSSGREYVKRNVVLKANLSNEGYGECQYQFSRVVGGREDIIKEYSVDNTYIFVTDKIGQNIFYVTIKDKANQILKIRCNTSVTVVQYPAAELKGTLKNSATNYEYENRRMTLTANVTQGNGGYEYRFEEVYGGKTTVVQDYSSKNTYGFMTSGVGSHTYNVKIRDVKGKTLTLTYTMRVVKYPK